jgi:hypothetical protein
MGLYHEYRIYANLEKIRWYKKILANLYIPQWETISDTEIDILFIHESGIYAIEAKDMAGMITWYSDDSHWCQKFGRRISYSFPSPIRQNYGHIKSLERIIPGYQIDSLVVFSWRSYIKVIDPRVKKLYELRKYIAKQDTKKLTPDEIDSIYEKLEPFTHATREQEDFHIREIRERYRDV